MIRATSRVKVVISADDKLSSKTEVNQRVECVITIGWRTIEHSQRIGELLTFVLAEDRYVDPVARGQQFLALPCERVVRLSHDLLREKDWCAMCGVLLNIHPVQHLYRMYQYDNDHNTSNSIDLRPAAVGSVGCGVKLTRRSS